MTEPLPNIACKCGQPITRRDVLSSSLYNFAMLVISHQDVWHYHQHLFPRDTDDRLYTSTSVLMPPVKRAGYAELLRRGLAPSPQS